MSNAEFLIDFTPIPEKYKQSDIEDICAWAFNQLHKKEENKWYNKITRLFYHCYADDYFEVCDMLREYYRTK